MVSDYQDNVLDVPGRCMEGIVMDSTLWEGRDGNNDDWDNLNGSI
jgi:hypothetical protein